MLSIKTRKYLAIVCFSVAFLATRLPFLGYDEINPDAVNWHLRSEQFVVGLKSGDFLKTYQHYHPGVTLMWVMGVPIEVARQINSSYRIYNQDDFLPLHQIAKYSLVLTQLVFSIVLILALKDVLGLKKALLAVSVFTFEPWFLGNSRLLHMDVLLALFVILSLVLAYGYVLKRSIRYLLASGVFAGLAFLTKSVGALSIIFIFAALVVSNIKNLKVAMLFLLAVAVTTFVFFPALWVKPQFVLSDIYNEGLRIGTRRGHEQIVMGEETDVAGSTFYPLVMALKTSPLIWFGVALFVYHMVKNHRRYQKVDGVFLLYLAVFYLIYFLGMSLASKKIDRYMVLLFPLWGLISSTALIESVRNIKNRYNRVVLYTLLSLLAGIGTLYPLVKLYPYYFTYTNSFFGSAENANKIVGQKPFGIGIPELKDRLIEKYGNGVPLGFIDKKPMSMIYSNSKLFDVRETGTSKYALIILGPNEEMPQNVLDGKYKFVQDDAMYINGLEFWRVYKKVI